MLDKPVPLREALREAVETMLDLHTDVSIAMDGNRGEVDAIAARDVAKDRVAALIEQIPLVFEAREDDGNDSARG